MPKQQSIFLHRLHLWKEVEDNVYKLSRELHELPPLRAFQDASNVVTDCLCICLNQISNMDHVQTWNSAIEDPALPEYILEGSKNAYKDMKSDTTCSIPACPNLCKLRIKIYECKNIVDNRFFGQSPEVENALNKTIESLERLQPFYGW